MNVIDVGTKSHQILEGIQKAQKTNFLKKIKYLKNPYGSGGSSKKIVRIIENLKLKKIKLQKKNTY